MKLSRQLDNDTDQLQIASSEEYRKKLSHQFFHTASPLLVAERQKKNLQYTVQRAPPRTPTPVYERPK